MSYDAGDEEHVGPAKKRKAVEDKQVVEGLRTTLSTVHGRRWYWDLMEFCGVFRTSMTGNSQTFFNEGQRNVGLRLLADLTRHAPDAYMQMIKENAKEKS